jgi:predicted secreted protein
MFRIVLAGILALFWTGAQVAIAAERAEANLIGFSADGRYFAFEEYGIQDGSGFAYSSIYLIDLLADKWVGGAPFRGVGEDEATSLSQIRAQVFSSAAPSLGERGVGGPAVLVALNGDGEIGVDGRSLKFGMPWLSEPGSIKGDYVLRLEVFGLPSDGDCSDYFGADPVGFALTLAGEGTVRELARDHKVPRSRGCAKNYRIWGVAAPAFELDVRRGVVLISVFAGGFEGLDRRFIAVPLR